MFVDSFVQNEGWGGDTVGSALELVQGRGSQWDPGLMRPYLDSRGRACVTVNTGRMAPRKDNRGGGFITNEFGQPKMFPVLENQLVSERSHRGLPTPTINAGNLLTKEAWVMLDNVVLEAARYRLRAWADLRAANTYGGFDGMANPILEFERVTDVGEAVEDMDGMTEARSFTPKFDLQGMPLPITHSDFFLSSRFLAVSKNKGTPMDTTRAEMAGRRIGERIENVTIGLEASTTYGEAAGEKYTYANPSTVYGYMTHPDRITVTGRTKPTGANGEAILTDFLYVREQLYLNKFFGPYIVYTSTDWDQHLDNLFSTTEPSAGTLRKRLLDVEDIQDIRRLDFLLGSEHPFTSIWVQMTPETARAVNGMEITTVQWPSMGGMRLNFKVMCIQVPQIRSRFTGPNTTTAKTGIAIVTATV
jgi:hypothetical protein